MRRAKCQKSVKLQCRAWLRLAALDRDEQSGHIVSRLANFFCHLSKPGHFMLYLTRKVGDSVVIDDNIEVTVVEVRGKTVKLGFTFPEDVQVLRRELYDRIQEENRSAAASADLVRQLGQVTNAVADNMKTSPDADEDDGKD
jgi:carbon storage regulator|tara:strand:- start:3115 stop:3540 length:426 start_codon:yes stop_codon:yes gene_type:complete